MNLYWQSNTYIAFHMDNWTVIDISRYTDENGVLNLSSNNLPENCTHLKLTDPHYKVKSIGHFFLFKCKNLQSVDLSPLTNVESIGHFFLSDCKNLQSVDLSGLTNVESIEDCFLPHCKNLQSIELTREILLEMIRIKYGDTISKESEKFMNIGQFTKRAIRK